MKLKSIMEDVLLWQDNQGNHFCEFTISKEEFEKLGVDVGDEIFFKEKSFK